MKAEADLHFIQGSNQFVGHGWAYSPLSIGEPGWRFYEAAVFQLAQSLVAAAIPDQGARSGDRPAL